ncbi:MULTISPECIES: hypothetical protein [unclassified Bradyrhizobium]|uniref:hypothetical protein n=1 Tax=unclassified Bradyrhizobium TaxID=2631580 RepID=UPI0024799537|nr:MULTISPECIES: hypothetical protein [unclassified Bradyrhizobium]WGS17621.1 hypothetical protein MTX22_23620 [Bradyrhizobium sp. ISRA463]WGS24408.1 hypothetical protein MTX19_21285 [Bradyrhizobium sp. ISRA464]
MKNKKMSLSAAVAAVLAMTAATAATAAELPTYEKAGLPISAVQLQVLGAADVQEQPSVANSLTPHQLGVLAPRHQIRAAAGRSETIGRTVR